MINNYKAQRNVRAELSGAVDLGEPVSLYIAEDEVKYGAEVSRTGLKIKDIPVGTTWAKNATHYGWKAAGAGFDEGSPGTIALDAEGGGSIKVSVPANTGTSTHMTIYQEGIVYKVGQQYEIRLMAKASEASRKIRLQTNTDTAVCPLAEGAVRSDLDLTTDWAEYKVQWTATVAGSPQDKIQIARDNDDSDGWYFYINDVSVHEVIDHTYKLMAVNDTIPASNINAEGFGVMSDLLSAATETALDDVLSSGNNTFDFEDGSDGFSLIAANGFAKPSPNGVTFVISSNKGRFSNGASNQAKAGLAFDTEVGRIYDVLFDIDAVNNAELQVSLGSSNAYNGDAAITTSGVDDDYSLAARFTADATTSYLYLQLNTSDSGDYVDIDDLSIREVFGFDYYNAPAYKFGIVSSVYDQDTGAMKTVGAAGDQVDVTVQGECNVVRTDGSNQDVDKDYPIKRIMNDGQVFDGGVVDDMFPNAVGVVTETNDSTTTAKIILFQGVEFSEHFVHKNSLQVKAKCAETITKFRPVSLYLDSAGDLLCRHDDIPEKTPDADEDHTGVDPGKWGIAELGGASGEIIPVTVAGKTHINTNWSLSAGGTIRQILESGAVYYSTGVNNYAPNAVGTVMADNTGLNDVPITIFGGTPIGTITNWKRTIKVTAKANGAVTQYCPVSLYLDQYGDYKCVSDDIPNENVTSDNAIWCDFRKWGIAQETVANGENVEIIVQGRTNVVDTKDNAIKGEFVSKITSDGTVFSNSSTSNALSSLGIVEKESQVSDGAPGVIIIF